jgi:hypothetical protein
MMNMRDENLIHKTHRTFRAWHLPFKAVFHCSRFARAGGAFIVSDDCMITPAGADFQSPLRPRGQSDCNSNRP